MLFCKFAHLQFIYNLYSILLFVVSWKRCTERYRKKKERKEQEKVKTMRKKRKDLSSSTTKILPLNHLKASAQSSWKWVSPFVSFLLFLFSDLLAAEIPYCNFYSVCIRPYVFSSNPVRVCVFVRGFFSVGTCICSSEQCHWDPPRRVKICLGDPTAWCCEV